MTSAEWIESHNTAVNRYRLSRKRGKALPLLPEKLDPFQAAVMRIVGIVGGGIYNAPISPSRIDWQYGFNGVSLVWRRELSTWDRSDLTQLVFLCHEARIRCQIDPAGPRMLRLSFWQRKAEGGISERHPNLVEAVTGFFGQSNPTSPITAPAPSAERGEPEGGER